MMFSSSFTKPIGESSKHGVLAQALGIVGVLPASNNRRKIVRFANWRQRHLVQGLDINEKAWWCIEQFREE